MFSFLKLYSGHHPQVTAPQCHNCFTMLTYFLKSIRAWKLTKETLLVITNMINLTTLQMSTLKVSSIKYVFKETWLILQINHFAYQSEQNSGSLVLGWPNFDFFHFFKWYPISILLFCPKNDLQDVSDVLLPVKTHLILKVYRRSFTFKIIISDFKGKTPPIHFQDEVGLNR